MTLKKKLIAIGIVAVIIIAAVLAIAIPLFNRQDDHTGDFDWNFMNLSSDHEATIRLGIADTDDDEEMAQTLIDSFQETYPNIEVEIVRIAGSYAQSLQGMISSNTMPDVFWLKDSDVNLFAYKRITQDLSEAWELWEDDWVDKEDVVTSMLEIGTYDGNLHMIPRDYNKVTVAYNKALFQKYEVPLPTDDDWTWQDFLDTCAALRSKMEVGEYPVDANLYWPPVFNAIINGFGGKLIDNGSVVFDSEQAQDGLEAIRGLVQNNYAVNPSQVTLDTFAAGKTAMYFMSRPYAMSIIGTSLDVDYVAFPELPVNAVVGTGCTGYAMYRNSEHKDEAFLFLMSILSEDSQQAFGTTGASVPVLRSLFEDGIWLEVPSTDIHHNAFVAHEGRDLVADYMAGLNPELSVDVEGVLLTLVREAMSNPEKTIESICEEQKTKMINIITNF